jgi:GntR family transcriptional regulator, transcriptional repressor for pyruvate dehydrogenase complex
VIEDLKPVSRTSLSDGIVDQITGLIARGALKPGDRIPSEKMLCNQFGVGRTSVREALRSLSVMGILESRAGDGTFVAKSSDRCLERAFQWGLLLNPKVVEDLVETRLTLESHAASLAAARATPQNLRTIEEAIRGMEESISDPESYLEFDMAFHLEIARATQNGILENLLSTIRAYLQATIREALRPTPGRDSSRRATLSIDQHKKILAALKARNPRAARQAMSRHILSPRADLLRHLSQKSDAQTRPLRVLS